MRLFELLEYRKMHPNFRINFETICSAKRKMQRLQMALIMMEHKSFTHIWLDKNGKVQSKNYRYPYEKDDLTEEVMEYAKEMFKWKRR